MLTHQSASRFWILAFACILLLTGIASGQGIQASVGDIIPLSGYSYGSQTVYLFLTGPNLPVNGVALNDITKHADDGGFTKVQVDGNDHWSYKWGTANLGGRLDEGTYTIWVVNGPNDRSRLSEAEYSTIMVTLGKPSISIDTPVLPGAMELSSVPDGASVMIEEKYRGKTPLTISDLSPGTYAVTFSQFGYQKFIAQVPVEAGKISEVTATLWPDSGSLMINSVPSGASVLVDGTIPGITPFTTGNLSMGNHTVAVSLAGYISLQQTVTVIPGQTTPVNVGLSPAPVPQTTATTPAAAPSAAFLIAGSVAIMLLIQYIRKP